MDKTAAVASFLSFTFGVGLCGAAFKVKVTNLDSQLKFKNAELATLTAQVEKMETKVNKDSLALWIYKHSKIPLSFCKEISQALSFCDHPLLLASLMFRESSFNPTAKSSSGALGLGQVMPKVWLKELKEKKIIKEKRDLLGISGNVRATSYIVERILQQKKGDLTKTLFAYLGSQNKQYARDILTTYAQVKFNKLDN